MNTFIIVSFVHSSSLVFRKFELQIDVTRHNDSLPLAQNIIHGRAQGKKGRFRKRCREEVQG